VTRRGNGFHGESNAGNGSRAPSLFCEAAAPPRAAAVGAYLLGSLWLTLTIHIYRKGKPRSFVHQPLAPEKLAMAK